jgi:hypothetical protein
MESVIKYLYSLVDSLRLRSPKKIRPYQKQTTSRPRLLPFVTKRAFKGLMKNTHITMRNIH